MLKPENPEEPLYIGKVEYMYDEMLKGPTVHVHMFCRGNDTILGETSDPQELFIVDDCDDYPLGSVFRTAEVSILHETSLIND